ncbi:uncharacterized protein UBRO_01083 [Ustilago bromivora]|uniref:Uncharacterized protein n=1 Tax=Ustilago bromivora TaxID=307758 RepID=A0A1K0FV14_9BASI|nr:uncharacterized protein UBRO_01083 [Ustilago bromivora]SYW77319.1 uncharacterized protein UBRO2_01778 [Ustilago bromivora]
MAPVDSPYGRSQRAQQRPYYVPSSAVDDSIAKASSSTPSRSVPKTSTLTPQNGSASTSAPIASLNGKPRAAHGDSSTAASRLAQISPSAYDRFNEVAWVVDLSSRIGNALHSPIPPPPVSAHDSFAGSPSSSSSQAHFDLLPRHRVRLPRPSKEFKDLQQRFGLTQSSSSFSIDLDTSADMTATCTSASTRPKDPDSAIQWVQHAQDDFERRRADLERSRQGLLKRLEGDHQNSDTYAHDGEREAQHAAEGPVHPAVERSMLAAKSLQELMRSGGLQSEDGNDAEPGFVDLLATAEPIPGGSASPGPSSLFEANKGSDGTLNIEAILQQRAKMAPLDDQNEACPSQNRRSMLDLSQAPPAQPAKKPVIEVLGADAPASASDESSQADSDDNEEVHAQGASDRASSQASSKSDDSESESDAETGQQHHASARNRTQEQSATSRRAAPHPMDQIAIVDGVFKIIPARSDDAIDAQGSSVVAEYEEEERESRISEDEKMQDASDDQDSEADADVNDEEDEMEDQVEHDYTASRGSNQYRDDFGGMSTRDLLFEGLTGEADEPIVLSDSDEGEDDSDQQGQRGDVRDDDEEMEDDLQDELNEDSANGSESEQKDTPRDRADVPGQQAFEPQRQRQGLDQADDDQEEDENDEAGESEAGEQSGEEGIDANQEFIRQIQAQSSSVSRDLGAKVVASAGTDNITEQQPQSDIFAASLEQPQPTATANDQGDAMPDSGVEPEELDEDLRWSEIEADQRDDEDSRDADLPQSAAVDSAYRAMHGSQSTTGFVKVSQLLAGMQDAGSNANGEEKASNSRSDPTMGSIDPEILASFAESPASDATATASTAIGVESSHLERTASQTEADIFDAFTRQDASTDANEPSSQSDANVEPLLQSQPAEQHTQHDEIKDGDADATMQQPSSQPDQAIDQRVEAETEAAQEQEEKARAAVERETELPEDSAPTVKAAPVKDDHKPVVGEAEPGAPATGAKVEETSTESPAAAPSPPTTDDAIISDAPVDPDKPVLERVESTDVLEADVEDNSEDEAANEDIAIGKAREGSASAHDAPANTELAAPSAPIGETDNTVIDAESVRNTAAKLPDVANEALQKAVQNEVSQPRSASVVPEDEGIMSGDLADRDSSVERQATPSTSKAPSVGPESKDQVMDDAMAVREPVEADPTGSSSTSNKVKEAGDSDPEEEEVAEETEELAEENEKAAEEKGEAAEGDRSRGCDRQGSEAVVERLDDNVKPESKPVTNASELPTVNEPAGQNEDTEAQSSSSLHALVSAGRVPPSPASSDRRSTLSFTPFANRLGHRHLHGAAKRNLFAQMTEAASNFASSFTAPLRSLPSLLPIRERQASEKEEDDDKQDETETPAEVVAESSSTAETRQPISRSTKQIEPAEYTITTRSHCLYRRLELTDIERMPAFIVPGCSINHENACAEKARDLGVAPEQESDNWMDVDPDLLPLDVHQKLSRIVGIQILREGIFAEPDSSAAKLLMDGYQIDLDLTTSFDDKANHKKALFEKDAEEHKAVSFDDPKAEVKEEHKMDISHDEDAEQKSDVQQSSLFTPVKMEAGDEVKHETEDPETPSRATRQSSRHRRAGSAASTSSHHRSPRHPDPTNADADYLPDDERKSLYRNRHTSTGAPGDASITSLEEQLTAGEDDEGDQILPDAEQDAEKSEDTREAEVDESITPSPPKRKRGRARKSAATADMTFKPFADDEKQADQEDVKPPAESRPRKGCGRKRAASFVEVSSESQAQEEQGLQDAAAVEGATGTASPKSKRPRRGRKSKEVPAFDPANEEAKKEAEDGENDDHRAGSFLRTRSTRKDEGAVLEQINDEQHEEQATEKPADGGEVGQGGRRSRKRKQAATEDSSSVAEATPAETISNVDDAESGKQPRRRRRSQGGSRASSVSPSKATPRKNAKRKVLKLN